MPSVQALPPLDVFTDIDGDPLESGYISIGSIGNDPESSPIPVFWDSAMTIPAIQPVRTKGGYPSNSGVLGRLYVAASAYSIRIRNKNGTQISESLNEISSERLTVSVLDYGVVVNDTTKASSNLVAINNAISALSAAGGGTLEYPDGDIYVRRIDGAVTDIEKYIVMVPGVSHKGTGVSSTSLVRYGPHTILFTSEGVQNTNITVSDMTLDGNPGIVGITHFPANLAYLVDADNVIFSNVLFKDCPGLHSIDINGSQNVYVYNCLFMGNDSTLSLEFGGAGYFPEAIQISKHPTTLAQSFNVVVENCKWGASASYGATFAAIGNHSGGAGDGLTAQRVRVRGGVATGLQKYFVRPFCFDDVIVDDVKFTDTAGAFAFICGKNNAGVITTSTNIKLRNCYHDSSADSFVRTDGTLIAYPATARYRGLTIEDCEVVGRTTINATLLHFFDDVTLVRYKCDSALRGFLGSAISNCRVLNSNITNSQANGVELLDVAGGGAGLFLNKNLIISGGRVVESQFYGVSAANLDGGTIENVDVTGSSKAANTRGPVILTTSCQNIQVRGLYGRPNANPFQPLFVVTATSGLNITTSDLSVPFNGPAQVVNSATGNSLISRLIGFRTAPPTTGTWQLGDVFKNSSAAANTTKGWVCTGLPSTWTAEELVSGPIRIGEYTLATLPSASTFNSCMILVTDATGGPKYCRSNGTVWQIINTTTTVS